MTGAEHYEEAENLIDQAQAIPANNDETNPAAALALAEAQVHATLALAAATALAGFGDMPATDSDMWLAITSGDAYAAAAASHAGSGR